MARSAVDPTITRAPDVPEEIRALDVLGSDYVDVFVASIGDASDTSPEEWARAAMEGASAAGRFVAWRLLCNLRLRPGSSSEHIAGWEIVERNEEWIRVAARSWFMTANMVFRRAEGRLFFTTFVRYDNPVGRAIWGTVSLVHRRVAPDFLRAAVVRGTRGR